MRSPLPFAGWLGVALLVAGPLFPSLLPESQTRPARSDAPPETSYEVEVVEHHADPALERAVKRSLSLLAKGDYPNLRKRIAARGVMVTKRWLDWNQTQPLIDARLNGAKAPHRRK